MASHSWKLKSFNTITFCDHCGGLLWGICTQGYQCVDCNFSSHSKCTGLVNAICDQKTSILAEKAHSFYKTSKSIGKFCNHCRDTTFTISGECFVCKDCKYIVHESCKDSAANNCRIHYHIASKPTTTTAQFSTHRPLDGVDEDNSIELSQRSTADDVTVHYHHWVEGNLKDNKKCMHCNETCEKAFSLAHYKCLWCSKHLHSKCYISHNPICDFGAYSDLILPPSSVHLVDPTNNKVDWRLEAPVPRKTLFIFINPKSGGQMGESLLRKFSSVVNPVQLIDLIKSGPGPTLLKIKEYLQRNPNDSDSFRILVCGGDGTVGWLLHAMKEHNLPPLPVSILALGTGNDLSRTFGWGPGYDGEKLTTVLKEIDNAKIVKLDTWSIGISENIAGGPDKPVIEMNNYFSIGLDAMIALGFHLARNANPQLFTGRTVNKLWYSKIGLEMITKDIVKLNKIIKIHIGEDELEIDKSIEGIIIMNLGSYAGGNDLWGKKKTHGFKKQYIDDELLEILGVTSLTHLGSCLSGLSSPIKLAQGRNIRITLAKSDDIDTAYQVDGEPYPVKTNQCTFTINYQNQMTMLSPKSAKTKSSITKFANSISHSSSSSNSSLIQHSNTVSSTTTTPMVSHVESGYTSPPPDESSSLNQTPLSSGQPTPHTTQHKVVLGGGMELVNISDD